MGHVRQIVSCPLRRYHPFPQGRNFGIAAVISTARSMPPASNPSWTQSSARHQSS